MHSMVKSVAKLLARGHILNRRIAICLIQRSFLSSFYFHLHIPYSAFPQLALKGYQQDYILLENDLHFIKRNRHTHSSPIAGHPYPWCASPIFFTHSVVDLNTHSLLCSISSHFSLSFYSLYARAHTSGGLHLVWLTGIEKGKS